jgi:hypothetical protein
LVVKTAGKVDTQHLNPSVRANYSSSTIIHIPLFQEQSCLSLLVAQSDLLEWNKPKEVPNDFSRGGMNKQGKFELHNLRYKTRVRRSEQVGSCFLSNDFGTWGTFSVK